ncbi:hypothetical protein J4405_04560 [Candidatus Woesearchaeota archaeon]|nr:hypothetical protein [Candidatus Woesearchaeota archaeon]
MVDYKDAGVNIELGDDVSKILYNAARLTWKNRQGRLGEVVELFPDFSGLRAIHVGNLPFDSYMNLGFDGIGTKVELAERTSHHNTVAFDLFAMVCDDAVVRGAEPVIVGSILDVRSLEGNIEPVRQLAIGYIDAARAANVAIVNGEVAELGARVQGYGSFNYNWGAGVVWFARKSRLFTGFEIKEHDKIIALRENGFRSNGISLVRKILTLTYGDEWHLEHFQGKSLGDQVLHPSTIYTKAAVEMFGGFENEPRAEVHGIAHITGGGIPGKLGRVLKPSNLGAYLEPFEPSDLMLHCQEKGEVSDKKAYETWNMRHGMLIISPQPDAVMHVAQEHGIESAVVGEITSKPGIRIKSQGLYDKNKELVF